MKRIILLVILLLVLIGCQGAVITATSWDTGLGKDTKSRCERVDMRDNHEMELVFKRYDGWKLLYVSEYTTGNKIGTEGVVCFERAR